MYMKTVSSDSNQARSQGSPGGSGDPQTTQTTPKSVTGTPPKKRSIDMISMCRRRDDLFFASLCLGGTPKNPGYGPEQY
jgi:hypothetical protein